jgi:ApbE superfamily uncharacterized protein (UPF0280 family)
MTATAHARAAARAHAALLPDGRRLHLQDGPIDLIVEACGPRHCVAAAYAAARHRFIGLLDELCSELQVLRQPVSQASTMPSGTVARRMFEAIHPYAAQAFITPMAAVAGSVADEILAAMLAATDADLERSYVNNGGDIALHLAPGAAFSVGLIDRPDCPGLFGKATIRAGDGIGGIATSGARGRSFSLGIADAVTVLAGNGAQADAAATIIANAIDLPGHPAIVRVPARSLQPDSDLSDLLVTRCVPPLARVEIEAALAQGARTAAALKDAGLIASAALHLQGETRIVGALCLPHDRSATHPQALIPLQGASHA